MDFLVNSNHSCEVHLSQVFRNCSIQKCDAEGGLGHMHGSRQRVDTGGREQGEDLEALSSNVYWKLEHLQSRMNTAYC